VRRRSFIGLLAGLFVAPKKILAQPEEVFESWNIDCVSQLKIMRPGFCDPIKMIKIDKIEILAKDPDAWITMLDRKWAKWQVIRTGPPGEEIAIPDVVVKGPIQRITKITTYDQFRKIYGGPDRSTRVPGLDAKIRAALVGYRGDHV